MPNYSARTSSDFRPLTSAHRKTTFLRHLSDDQFTQFASLAKSMETHHIHQQAFDDIGRSTRYQLIHGLWAEQKSKHAGEEVGGGLGDAFNYIGNKMSDLGHATWKPFQSVWNYAQNAMHYFTHDNSISNHTKMVARMIKETYKKDKDARADHMGPFQRVPEFSNSWIDVWKGEDTNQIFVTCRGSVDAADWLIDDVGIATGQGPRDLIGADLKRIFDKYEKEYDIEVAGHSLGGALVAEGLKSYNLDADRIDFFNPGASPIPWSKDAVNEFASDKDAYFFVNAIDPVSLGQLGEKPQHLIMNNPQSWTNPIDNHSIDQWFKMDQ